MKQVSPLLALLMARAGIPVAFNNKAGWKMDGDKIALSDGNPVYLKDDGTEMTIDVGTISRLNGEAKTHREAKERAEAALKAFEGLDAKAAREAMEKLSKIDQKQLIESGEVEKLKAQIGAEYQKQVDGFKTTAETLQSRLNSMMLDSAFSQSQFLQNNIAIPMEFVRSYFGQNFTVENDKIIAKDRNGNPLHSTKRMGEPADFDEAIELLVSQHPQKDSILKLNTGNGTGNQHRGGNPGARNMRRGDFEKLPPMQQAEVAAKVGKGEMNLTD